VMRMGHHLKVRQPMDLDLSLRVRLVTAEEAFSGPNAALNLVDDKSPRRRWRRVEGFAEVPEGRAASTILIPRHGDGDSRVACQAVPQRGGSGERTKGSVVPDQRGRTGST